MIVITALNTLPKLVFQGETFEALITDATGHQFIISESIQHKRVIDYVAVFRFALNDGTCFNLSSICTNREELPPEFADAVLFDDLDMARQDKFRQTISP